MSAFIAVPPLIACVECNGDIAALIREVLDSEGFLTLTYTCEISTDVRPLIAFLSEFQPKTVIYSVDPPYAEEWEQFQRVQSALPSCAWMIATTDIRTLEELAGANASVALLSKPFDVDELVAAVHRQMLKPVAA